jgi:hypothetical protein
MAEEYGLDEYERQEFRRHAQPEARVGYLPEGVVPRRRWLHPSSWQSDREPWTPGFHTKVTLPAALAFSQTFRLFTVGGPRWLLLVPAYCAYVAVQGLIEWRSGSRAGETKGSSTATTPPKAR